ncbi:MAG: DUF4160 domain-containing protein [Polyangiales bacterium]
MPTVLRLDGYRLFFFSDEGSEPPHVHVERGGGVAKYWLKPFSMAYYRNMTFGELRSAGRLVEQHRDFLLKRWNDYFGR